MASSSPVRAQMRGKLHSEQDPVALLEQIAGYGTRAAVDEPLGRPFAGIAARPTDKGQTFLDAEGLEIVDLAPGATLVEQRERLAHDAAFGVEGLAAPFGRQALKGDDMEQLCENWSRDFAADLDRCGNAISHDSLHRWSGE